MKTASRMESHGLPDCIHCTEHVARLMGDSFRLEGRGTMEVKGNGTMSTYCLVGKKDHAHA